MKKLFMTLFFAIALLIFAAPVCSEEMAKEGTGSSKGYYISNLQILSIEKEAMRMNYEGYGIVVSDTGEGLFHNSSQHTMGGMYVVNGVIEDSGFIAGTITSGDKYWMTYKASGKMGKPTFVKGTYTYMGGTGALKGIQGGGEFTRYTLQPPAEGKGASFSQIKSHWKLP